MKRALTLEDLYRVFEEKGISHYSATETGWRIAVQIPGTFSLSEDTVEGKLPVVLKACHTGLNRNGSFI